MFGYLSKEEQANTWTHLVAVAGTIAVTPLLLIPAWQSENEAGVRIFGTLLFLAGMLFMYLSSTLYHAVTHPTHKRRLRVMDHISIYVMIAGSYSVLCMCALSGWLRWTLFGFMWACVAIGTISKVVALGKSPRLSLILYLVMGWTALVVIVPLWQKMPHAAFFWMIAEGVFYSIGAYFFSKDEEHAFYHAIWHVFILLGSASHTIATYLCLQ